MEEILNNAVGEKNSEADFIAWYEDVCTERLSILESEEKYKKRVEELERNSEELLKAFEEVQQESKKLREKYEPSEADDAYLEPYNVIYKERNVLMKKDKSNKSKIKSLEKEVESLRDYIKGLETDKVLRYNKKDLKRPVNKGYIVITGEEKINDVEAENRRLQIRIEHLQHECDRLIVKNRYLEEKWCEIQMASDEYTKEWDRFHEKVTGFTKGGLSFPGIFRKAKRDGNKTSKTALLSSSESLPSIEENLQSPRLMYGSTYQRLHRIRSQSRKSLSSQTVSSESYDVE